MLTHDNKSIAIKSILYILMPKRYDKVSLTMAIIVQLVVTLNCGGEWKETYALAVLFIIIMQ